MSKYKFLLVDDNHHISVRDIFQGYINAFGTCGIEFDIVDTTTLTNQNSVTHMSDEGAYALALAKLLNTENEFTHCFVLSGMKTPEWFFKSKYDKKMCLITLDDPHSSAGLLDKAQKHVDFWFTNEKKFKGDKIHYLPVATDGNNIPTVSKQDIQDRYKSDICFVGTIYDDRIKPLEAACRYAEKYGKTIKILGPHLKTPKDSIIRKHSEDCVLNIADVKMFYRGAGVVINIDRNIQWCAGEEDSNSQLVDVGEPISTNPRTYDIAACRSAQLFVHPRAEVKSWFNSNIFYADYDTVYNALDEYFNTPQEEVYEKINTCFNIVKADHTYVSRVLSILNYLKEKE